MFEIVMLAALSTAAFFDFTVEMVEALLRLTKSKKPGGKHLRA
jgi:hypothetical protein